jgi:hypothetical protein
MKEKKSRKLRMRAHAARRAAERYHFSFMGKNRKEIVALIRDQKAAFVQRHSLRVSEFLVPFGGETFRVLYDKHRHEIITFLPPQTRESQ